MQFNRSRTNRRSRFDLRRIGFNENRNAHIGRPQPRDGVAQKRPGTQHVQAAFRCQLRTLFRHDAATRRADTLGEGNHFLGRRHFEIERRRDLRTNTPYIAVPDVAAIFTEMNGNAIRPGFHRDACSFYRAGMRPTTRIAQCRHMINIHR